MRFRPLPSLLLLAVACAEAPPPPPPPMPPPPQPVATRRPPARPAPRTATAPPTAATAEASEVVAARPTWRVRADGVVGCADAEGLQRLRALKADPAAAPRQIAEAHRDGRCLTTFSGRVWTLEQDQGALLRLRLVANGGPGGVLLWFAREEVEPAGASS